MNVDVQKSIRVRCEEIDVAALLRSSLAPLIEQAKRQNVELRVVTLGDVPKLAVDPEKIAWGVATIVGNALRYVQRGGDANPGGSVLVQLEHDETKREVAIAVQDDGPGIPEDKLPYLFERRNGSAHAEGLSLSLVRDIVIAHDGQIDVASLTGEE